MSIQDPIGVGPLCKVGQPNENHQDVGCQPQCQRWQAVTGL
jgi:hypothetical protein